MKRVYGGTWRYIAGRGPPLGRSLKADLIGPTLTKEGGPKIKTDRHDKFEV